MMRGRFFAIAITAVPLTIASMQPALSVCAEMWVSKFTGDPPASAPTRCSPGHSTCIDGSDGRRVDVRVRDKFMLCARVPHDVFITVWDSGPQTSGVRRIYPNVLTHRDNARVLGDKLSAGVVRCFGHRDFPLFFPAEQGLGQGRLTLFGTSALDDQPTIESMRVPGEQMARRQHEMVEATLMSAVDCRRQYSHTIIYNVSN